MGRPLLGRVAVALVAAHLLVAVATFAWCWWGDSDDGLHCVPFVLSAFAAPLTAVVAPVLLLLARAGGRERLKPGP